LIGFDNNVLNFFAAFGSASGLQITVLKKKFGSVEFLKYIAIVCGSGSQPGRPDTLVCHLQYSGVLRVKTFCNTSVFKMSSNVKANCCGSPTRCRKLSFFLQGAATLKRLGNIAIGNCPNFWVGYTSDPEGLT